MIEGMTLRDWFAGQVLTAVAGAILTNTAAIDGFDSLAREKSISVQRAQVLLCYAMADAMLAERSKAQGGS